MSRPTKWEKFKRKVAMLGLFYVFVLSPIGIIAFVLFGGLDTSVAQSIMDFLSNVTSGPAGEYLWETSNGTSPDFDLPVYPRP